MDVKIENGALAVTHCGKPVYIDSIQELAQRVYIACTVKRGSFVLDKTLGSYAHTVDINSPLLREKLTMLFMEATIDIPYDELVVEDVTKNSTTLDVKLRVVCADESACTEVSIDV